MKIASLQGTPHLQTKATSSLWMEWLRTILLIAFSNNSSLNSNNIAAREPVYQLPTSLTVVLGAASQDKILAATMPPLERQPETPSNPVRHRVQLAVISDIEWVWASKHPRVAWEPSECNKLGHGLCNARWPVAIAAQQEAILQMRNERQNPRKVRAVRYTTCATHPQAMKELEIELLVGVPKKYSLCKWKVIARLLLLGHRTGLSFVTTRTAPCRAVLRNDHSWLETKIKLRWVVASTVRWIPYRTLLRASNLRIVASIQVSFQAWI